MKKLMLPVVATAMLFGCATNTGGKVSSIGSMGNISVVSGSAKSIIGTNGLLQGQVTLHNTGSSVVTGFYRCKFNSPTGMQVGDDQVWQQVTIYPDGNQNVKCLATEKEATDFVLEFSADGNNVNAIQ